MPCRSQAVFSGGSIFFPPIWYICTGSIVIPAFQEAYGRVRAFADCIHTYGGDALRDHRPFFQTPAELCRIVLITFSCILLSWNSGQVFGVLFACTFWGMDNNFSRMISGKDPIAA